MGKRIGVAVAGLATFVTSLGVFGDDVGRLISHTPHKPPPISIPHHPVPIPHELPPILREPPPILRVPVPPVVVVRTKHLSAEDAETVTKAACELKDLDAFVSATSDGDRWRIAGEKLSDVLFGEDELATAVGLAQDVINGEDVDAVDEYCKFLG